MRLHCLTACSRPQNLPAVATSLASWGDVDVVWHLRLDLSRHYIGGQVLKNDMLDSIADGWVWMLDDDTIALPDLYRRAAAHFADAPAIVVSQKHSVLGILHAAPENVEVGKIDIGQALIRRDVIGEHRIPEEYAGDGMFLESVLQDTQDVVYLDEILSLHNALEE